MVTAYSPILKLALPVQGELSGTWGDVVNDNITSMVEQAIAGRAVINTWTVDSHTLTTANGTTSESRCAMLELTDTGTALAGAGTVICPTASKIYIVKNATGQNVTVTTSGGTGILVPNGRTTFLFCDGTNVVEAMTHTTSLQLGTSTVVTAVLDEDNMASDSATALATQQSIKAYVDSQVTAQDLDIVGDTGTGAVDLDSQSLTIAGTANEIETAASGQTVTVGLPAAVTVTTSVTTPLVRATNLNANDGASAISIANATGVVTVNSAVLTTADINGGTIDGTVIGGITAAAGSFTTVGTTGNITSQGQVITNTINEQTATSGVTIDGVLLKDNGITASGTVNFAGATISDGGSVTTVDINGGTVDGVTIGGASAGAGTFTNLTTSGTVTFSGSVLSAAGLALIDDADAAAQRTTLGLGTIATQAANNVAITGGSITNITDIAVADGGTGVSTVPTNGQLLIGTGTGYSVAALTAGAGVTITNGSGSITVGIPPRAVAASGTSGTLTPDGDTTDVYNAFALSGAITLAAPSGTPIDGQRLILRFKDDGSARAITWTTTSGAYRELGIILPTTTTAGKVTYVGCIYNSTDSFWDAVALTTQA
jgi:hypothetical protein